MPRVPAGACDLCSLCVAEGARLPANGGFRRPCSGREAWFAARAMAGLPQPASRERDLRYLVCAAAMDGEGEGIFAVMAPGLDHQTGGGRLPSRLPRWLGGQNSGSFSLLMGECWLGLGHSLPATPSSFSGPSGFPPLALLYPVTDASQEGEFTPLLSLPALGHLLLRRISAVPFPSCPSGTRGAKPIFLRGFQPSCNFDRTYFPPRAEEGGWVCCLRSPGKEGLKSLRVPAAVALSPPCPGAAKRGLR